MQWSDIFWNITPCSLLKESQRFGEAYQLEPDMLLQNVSFIGL
jgi:hypothetical protein